MNIASGSPYIGSVAIAGEFSREHSCGVLRIGISEATFDDPGSISWEKSGTAGTRWAVLNRENRAAGYLIRFQAGLECN
jgi:hypothetical protein